MTKSAAEKLGFSFLVSFGLCIVLHNGERVRGAEYASLSEALAQSYEWGVRFKMHNRGQASKTTTTYPVGSGVIVCFD